MTTARKARLIEDAVQEGKIECLTLLEVFILSEIQTFWRLMKMMSMIPYLLRFIHAFGALNTLYQFLSIILNLLISKLSLKVELWLLLSHLMLLLPLL